MNLPPSNNSHLLNVMSSIRTFSGTQTLRQGSRLSVNPTQLSLEQRRWIRKKCGVECVQNKFGSEQELSSFISILLTFNKIQSDINPS